MHFNMIPGGNLDKTNYFLFTIFMNTFPSNDVEVIETPFIYLSDSCESDKDYYS